MSDARAVVEHVYAALAAGDADRLATLLHPDIEATFTTGLPHHIGGTHRGRDAVLDRGWWALGRAFDVVADTERWLVDPPTVVVTGTYRGKARRTGRLLETGFCHTWTVDDHVVTGLVQLTDAAAWSAALTDTSLISPAPTDAVQFRHDPASGIATIELADPDRHNRIDVAMGAGIAWAIEQADTVSPRCVLVRAQGADFTVGGDLDHFLMNLDRLDTTLDSMIGPYHAALAELGHLAAPVVCAVQGAAAGGGLGLLWASDVIIAADDLKLTTGFPKIGLSGDGGATWALPRLVGLRKALQLSFASPVLDAAAALDAGLVDRVVPAADLHTQAAVEAERLAAGPTTAYGHLRRLLRQSTATTWAEQLQAERQAMVDCARTADAREGINAFAERRPPTFGGTA